MKTVIFDIDGTLANIVHRRVHLEVAEGEKKDWKTFNSLMGDDEVVEEIAHICNNYENDGYYVVLCTGRGAEFKAITESWLLHNSINYHVMLMRSEGDFRSDVIVKQEMHDQIVDAGCEIEIVYDDRPCVIRMWRENGLEVVDCGDGVEF